jgi:hypothetical protein
MSTDAIPTKMSAYSSASAVASIAVLARRGGGNGLAVLPAKAGVRNFTNACARTSGLVMRSAG